MTLKKSGPGCRSLCGGATRVAGAQMRNVCLSDLSDRSLGAGRISKRSLIRKLMIRDEPEQIQRIPQRSEVWVEGQPPHSEPQFLRPAPRSEIPSCFRRIAHERCKPVFSSGARRTRPNRQLRKADIGPLGPDHRRPGRRVWRPFAGDAHVALAEQNPKGWKVCLPQACPNKSMPCV